MCTLLQPPDYQNFCQENVAKTPEIIGEVADNITDGECQQRGQFHNHGAYRVNDVPVYGLDLVESVIEWIDHRITCSATKVPDHM